MNWVGSTVGAGILAAGILGCVAVANADPQPPSMPDMQLRSAGNRLVMLPDGRRLNVNCTGSGPATVVLEAGFDWGGSWSWFKVQPEIAKFARVCSYDRAGIGLSDPGPLPRDGAHITADLHALMSALGEKPPYVLVGQSVGGVLVRVYRVRHPEDAAAMVLIDPAQPGKDAWRKPWKQKLLECLTLARSGAVNAGTKDCMPPGMDNPPPVVVTLAQRPATWEMLLSELDNVDSYFAELKTNEHSPYATPLIVLTASEQNLDKKALTDWIAGHKRIAALSTRGEQRLITKSSHSIQLDRPDAVVQAIKDAIAEAGVSR
ncbi:MAG: alpha/beta hydrolase [Alphaproteobacteria bacterium]